MFSEVYNSVDVYPDHFVLFVWWEILNARDMSRKVMVWICSCSADWDFFERGLPRVQRASVASHIVVSSWSPVYWIKRSSFLVRFSGSI
jgi:hypothetical protein